MALRVPRYGTLPRAGFSGCVSRCGRGVCDSYSSARNFIGSLQVARHPWDTSGRARDSDAARTRATATKTRITPVAVDFPRRVLLLFLSAFAVIPRERRSMLVPHTVRRARPRNLFAPEHRPRPAGFYRPILPGGLMCARQTDSSVGARSGCSGQGLRERLPRNDSAGEKLRTRLQRPLSASVLVELTVPPAPRINPADGCGYAFAAARTGARVIHTPSRARSEASAR
jgi:hypothetical protein